MRIRHIHLPNLTHYAHAQTLQDRLARTLLDYKKLNSGSTHTPPPEPTIITATFHPVYTCGRREISTVTDSQIDYLRAPVDITGARPDISDPDSSAKRGTKRQYARAEFHTALRGGQTTYHGPGQLVAYPILDLKTHVDTTASSVRWSSAGGNSESTNGISARTYVHGVLEESVLRTLARYGVSAFRTGNPGLWTKGVEMEDGWDKREGERERERERKICAVGVHLRRGVASHGVAVNVDERVQPWFERVVACGLEGVGVEWLERARMRENSKRVDGEQENTREIPTTEVGDAFVDEFAKLIGTVDEIVRVDEDQT
ncbi:MAG: hypothetical protein M1831_006680 [Alyxoria varia]|nr:MAG: hypothetical protein M1831_006680 [Alyxoria varia]